MTICAVLGCSQRKGKGISLFGLPTVIQNQCEKTKDLSERRRAEWLTRINRNLKGKPSYLFDNTHPDWAPSLHLGYESGKHKYVNRYLRANVGRNKNDATHQSSSRMNVTPTVANVEDHAAQQFLNNELLSPNSVTHSHGVEDIKQEPESRYDEPVSNTIDQPSLSSDSCYNMGEDIKQEPESRYDEPLSNTIDQPSLSSDSCYNMSEDIKHEPESRYDEPVSNTIDQPSLSSDSCYSMDKIGVLEVSKNVECQTDLQPQELTKLREMCIDLMKNNNLLKEQNSFLSVQVNSLTSAKEQLQSERDMLHKDNVSLRDEVEKLKKQLKNVSLDENSLQDDNAKTKFYTGIPTFNLLKNVYDFVECKVPHSHRNAIPKFSEFLLTMLRIRLGLLETDLAYRFNISQPTVCNICSRWIEVMSVRLRSIITWPERNILQRTIPKCFKEVFGDKFTVIVDCFEICINRPSSQSPRAETCSQYKHHNNTVKFLIGITPQGTVCFISEAWAGRVSDKHITLESGFLDNLAPGDVVLADRGFDIDEHVGVKQAKIAIPAFTKGKTQLCFDDIQKTREIDNVRIHVGRVIGFIKRKFRILGGVFPYSYLVTSSTDAVPTIDKIVTICCALTNLCPSLIREQVTDSMCVTDDD